jgi:hypothetical protein
MGEINNYSVESVRINDRILASDGISGATKNVSAGDVAELAGCKVYRAFMTQTGTNAPVPTIVGTNTIGDLVWARSTAGTYTATLVNGFVGNATAIVGTSPSTLSYGFQKMTSDYIVLTSEFNGTLSDGMLVNKYIEIRVY